MKLFTIGEDKTTLYAKLNQAYNQTGKLPKLLVERTVVPAVLLYSWEAFWELSPRRKHDGMSGQRFAIEFSEIESYSRIYKPLSILDIKVIIALDNAYLAYMNNGPSTTTDSD